MQLFSFNPVVCFFKNRVGIYFKIDHSYILVLSMFMGFRYWNRSCKQNISIEKCDIRSKRSCSMKTFSNVLNSCTPRTYKMNISFLSCL